MLSASYQDHGVLPPQIRADVSARRTWGGIALEGGIGLGRSQLLGDEFKVWSSVELRLPAALRLLVGVDYDRWHPAASRYLTFVPDEGDYAPPWRFTVNIQKQLALPLRFLE